MNGSVKSASDRYIWCKSSTGL